MQFITFGLLLKLLFVISIGICKKVDCLLSSIWMEPKISQTFVANLMLIRYKFKSKFKKQIQIQDYLLRDCCFKLFVFLPQISPIDSYAFNLVAKCKIEKLFIGTTLCSFILFQWILLYVRVSTKMVSCQIGYNPATHSFLI